MALVCFISGLAAEQISIFYRLSIINNVYFRFLYIFIDYFLRDFKWISIMDEQKMQSVVFWE